MADVSSMGGVAGAIAVMFPEVMVACPFATVTEASAMYPLSGDGVVCVPVVAAVPAFALTTTMPDRLVACVAPVLFGPL